MDDSAATNSGTELYSIPQAHGGALLRGGVPGNNGGRPRRGTSALKKTFSTASLQALRELGIDVPGKLRLDVDGAKEIARIHLPEIIGRMVWLSRQVDRPKYAETAYKAMRDLANLAGVNMEEAKVLVEHSGTVNHQHQAAATSAFLERALSGHQPALPATIEGELSTGPDADEQLNITPVTRSGESYPQDAALHQAIAGEGGAVSEPAAPAAPVPTAGAP